MYNRNSVYSIYTYIYENPSKVTSVRPLSKVYVRTVQLTGGSTLIVSLPREWAKRAGVSKGSKLLVEVMPDNALRVTPYRGEAVERATSPEVTIEAEPWTEADVVAKRVISAYIAGYKVFRITYREPNVEAIQRLKEVVTSKMMNVVVTEESEKHATVRVVGGSPDLSIGEAAGLMARHLGYMFRELVRAARDGDRRALEAVQARDDEVDRVYIAVARRLTGLLLGESPLSGSGLGSLAEAIHYYHGLKAVERIADHVTGISRELSEMLLTEGRIDEDIARLMEDVGGIVSRTLSALTRLDVGAAEELIPSIESRRRTIGSLMREAGRTSLQRYAVLLSLSRVLGYCLDVIEDVYDIVTLGEVLRKRGQSVDRRQ